MPQFQCQVPGCTSSYRRKEHLRRHEMQHRGSHLRTCPTCGRVFSRSDSLRRHIRGNHDDPGRSLTRATQACTRCRMMKTRCQGGSPCTECSSRGHLCMFDDPAFPDIEPPQPDPEEVEKYSGDNPINTSNEKSGRVEHYVHLYFAHFHPHWPFLHRSTFSVPDEPPLLLQAVLMIGLWVSGNPEAQQGARDLHSKLGQAISAQRGNWERLVEEEQDKEPSVGLTSRWPIATYQGILLYIIFSLLASRPVGLGLNLGLILNDSDRQILSALNTTCLRNNIFYYPNMLTRYRNVESFSTCMWVGVEEIKRLGLALYKVSRLCGSGEYDEAHSRGLCLSDLQFPMPDKKSLWEAGSNAELSRLLLIYSRRGDKSDDPRGTDWFSHSGMILEIDGLVELT